MKYGSTKRHNTKPITLTLDIARAICVRIESDLPIFSRHSKTLLLDEYLISKNTYQSWLRSGIVPIDNPRGRSLSRMVAEAQRRKEYRRLRTYEGRQKRYEKSESFDLSTKIKFCRRYANGNFIETEIDHSCDQKKLSYVLKDLKLAMTRMNYI